MKLVLMSLSTVALMLASPRFGLSAEAGRVVKATIWPNLDITFSPKAFKRGTVVIEVTNRTAQRHQFTIDGVTSASVEPHRTVSITVTFRHRAIYAATLPDCGYLSVCSAKYDTSPTGYAKVT